MHVYAGSKNGLKSGLEYIHVIIQDELVYVHAELRAPYSLTMILQGAHTQTVKRKQQQCITNQSS